MKTKSLKEICAELGVPYMTKNTRSSVISVASIVDQKEDASSLTRKQVSRLVRKGWLESSDKACIGSGYVWSGSQKAKEMAAHAKAIEAAITKSKNGPVPTN